MKKVLFVIGNAEIGGTRTSLFNLLHHLSKEDDIEIYLYMLSHYGSLMDRIPDNITVISENWKINASLPGKPHASIVQESFHAILKIVKSIVGYKKLYAWIFKAAAKSLYEKYGEFDAVFGYQEGICNYFSAFVTARKHYAWIHKDIESWYVENEFEYETYNNSDGILFVADTAQRKFCTKYPEFSKKCNVIKNTINCAEIKEKASQKCKTAKTENIRIYLSVGRVAKQKAFERIVPIARKLKESEASFRWYILGDGPEREHIQDMIKQNKLENEVIMLGSTDNPYKYMSNADILVVTSIYESQPMVILEALTVGLPVITTRYSSAEEILKDKPYGIICENNEEALANCLLNISEENVENMRLAASCYEYDNKKIVDSIRGLIL